MNKQITVISGLLLKDGKIFLQRRSEKELKDAHMKWEIPGGKVDFGETPQESLKREFMEEAGIEVDVKELLPFSAVKQHMRKDDHHVYEVGWFTPDEVRTLESLPGMDELIHLAEEFLAKRN